MDVSMEILDMPEQDKATTKFQATDVLLNGSALFFECLHVIYILQK